ncbi:MAG: PHP domain-containing protein [Agathobacter rectalis]
MRGICGTKFALDRETSHGDDRYYHLILLAENNTGYANLMKIVSIGFTEGYYYRPRVDFETLERYHEGLYACLPVWQEKSPIHRQRLL